MELEYTYWDDGDGWLIGFLNMWPDHWTQGKGIAELEEMLLDLYEICKAEQIEKTSIRKIGKLRVPA